MLLSIEALEKSGKSALAYTAPRPIVGFSFDMGSRRALYGTKFEYFKDLKIVITDDYKTDFRGNDITIYEKPIPIQLNTNQVTGCVALLNEFQSKLSEAGQNKDVKSIIIDTTTLARRLAADAHLESLGNRVQLTEIEWAKPNDATRSWWNFCQAMGKNMVGTHHLSEEYQSRINSDGKKESSPTGNMVLEGYKKTHQAVDVAIRLSTSVTKGVWMPTATILNCGPNQGLIGTKIDDPDWNKIVGLIEMSLGGRIKL